MEVPLPSYRAISPRRVGLAAFPFAAGLALLLSSHAVSQDLPTIVTAAEHPALVVPAARIVPSEQILESNFRMLVGDQSAGN